MRQQVPTEASEVVSAHYDVINHGNRIGGSVLRYRVHDPTENIGSSDTQRCLDVFFFDLVAGKTDHLIERGLSVAH
jgi:hypothetical protein